MVPGAVSPFRAGPATGVPTLASATRASLGAVSAGLVLGAAEGLAGAAGGGAAAGLRGATSSSAPYPPVALPPGGVKSESWVVPVRPWTGCGQTLTVRSTWVEVALPVTAPAGSTGGRSSAMPNTTPSTTAPASSELPVRLPPSALRSGALRPVVLSVGFFMTVGQLPDPGRYGWPYGSLGS